MTEPYRAPLAQTAQRPLQQGGRPLDLWSDSPRELIEKLSRLGSLVGVLRQQLSDYQAHLPPAPQN
jgi:hypothetical protein